MYVSFSGDGPAPSQTFWKCSGSIEVQKKMTLLMVNTPQSRPLFCCCTCGPSHWHTCHGTILGRATCAYVLGSRADSFDMEFETVCILNFPKGNFVPDLALGSEYHGAISSHAHRMMKPEQREKGGTVVCVAHLGRRTGPRWTGRQGYLRRRTGPHLLLWMGGCWLLVQERQKSNAHLRNKRQLGVELEKA